MQIFKIKNTKTGLFSSGGMDPRFTKEGKTWTSRRALSLHLNLLHRKKDVYADCEVVICEVVEVEATPVSIMMDESLARAAEREAKAKERIRQWQLERDRQHFERLKKQFG